MNHLNMISGGGGFQFQIKEDEFLGSQKKQVDDYPEELDLWLEKHISEMGEEGPGLSPPPTTNTTFSLGRLGGGVVVNQTPVVLQQGGGQRLVVQQGAGGNLVLQQHGQIVVQQGLGGQQVMIQQQSVGGGLVPAAPQQQNFQQSSNGGQQQTVTLQQKIHQPTQAQQQMVQHQPLVEQQQSVNHQNSQQLPSIQHLLQNQQPHVTSGEIITAYEDQYVKPTEPVKINKPVDGKVVMWNEMPEVPNAAKDSDGKYPCDQCDYKATRQWNLKKHKLSVHEGVKYSCDECDYKATDQSQVKKHKRSKHEV